MWLDFVYHAVSRVIHSVHMVFHMVPHGQVRCVVGRWVQFLGDSGVFECGTNMRPVLAKLAGFVCSVGSVPVHLHPDFHRKSTHSPSQV